MTKVNENGQVEWTFEELDLDGELDSLNYEMKEITSKMEWAHKTDQNEDFNILYIRYKLLSSIWDNIAKMEGLI